MYFVVLSFFTNPLRKAASVICVSRSSKSLTYRPGINISSEYILCTVWRGKFKTFQKLCLSFKIM